MQNGEQVTGLTPEQIERLNKLESIFIPHARRRRDKIFRSGNTQVPSAKFVHYTSAEAALKIIKSKSLWMRNATCMADYREVQHGFTILQKFFSAEDKLKMFTDSVNVCANGAADEAISLFNGWWNSIQFNTFIASISEHDAGEDYHGRLSMWRAFGGNPARVALVFNVPLVSKAAINLHLRFCPVAYLTDDEQKDLIPEVVKNICKDVQFLQSVDKQEMVSWIFSMLLVGVTCLKHEGFREEREWRVVHCPDFDVKSKLITSSVETINGIPQLVYKLPLDKSVDPILEDIDFSKIFDRLIIGPSQYPVAMSAAFVNALSQIGVPKLIKKFFPRTYRFAPKFSRPHRILQFYFSPHETKGLRRRRRGH